MLLYYLTYQYKLKFNPTSILCENKAALRTVGPYANVITGTPKCIKDLNLKANF